MDEKLIGKLKSLFDDIIHVSEDGEIEFWFARELQPLLGYAKWDNFLIAIKRAMLACKNAGGVVAYHFPEARKMVDIGSGAVRTISDYALTRYACYLIAQNGDPRKDEISFAQSYFAVQTRKQEIIEDRIKLRERLNARDKLKETEKRLSQNIYERGVDDPVQSLDDINEVSFIDLLRALIQSKEVDKNCIISTHDHNFSQLMKIKLRNVPGDGDKILSSL